MFYIYLPILALVVRLQLFFDSLLLHEVVPVELGLVEAAHLLLLPRDDVHDARDATRPLAHPSAAGGAGRGGCVAVRLLLLLEEFLGFLGILVPLLSDPAKKSNLGQKLKSFDSRIESENGKIPTSDEMRQKTLTCSLSVQVYSLLHHQSRQTQTRGSG